MSSASLSPTEPDDRLVNSAEVRRLWSGIGTSTLDRWLNGEKQRRGRRRRTAPLAGFPKPIKIGDRNYWRLGAVRRSSPSAKVAERSAVAYVTRAPKSPMTLLCLWRIKVTADWMAFSSGGDDVPASTCATRMTSAVTA